jgi:hypothetical protein
MTPDEAVKNPVKFIKSVIDEVKNKERGYKQEVMRESVPAWGNGKDDYKKCER